MLPKLEGHRPQRRSSSSSLRQESSSGDSHAEESKDIAEIRKVLSPIKEGSEPPSKRTSYLPENQRSELEASILNIRSQLMARSETSSECSGYENDARHCRSHASYESGSETTYRQDDTNTQSKTLNIDEINKKFAALERQQQWAPTFTCRAPTASSSAKERGKFQQSNPLLSASRRTPSIFRKSSRHNLGSNPPTPSPWSGLDSLRDQRPPALISPGNPFHQKGRLLEAGRRTSVFSLLSSLGEAGGMRRSATLRSVPDLPSARSLKLESPPPKKGTIQQEGTVGTSVARELSRQDLALEKSQKENAMLRHQIEQLIDRNIVLDKDLQKSQQQLQEAQKAECKLEEANSEGQQLRDELVESCERIQGCEQTVSTLKENVRRIERHKEHLNAQTEELQKKDERLERQIQREKSDRESVEKAAIQMLRDEIATMSKVGAATTHGMETNKETQKNTNDFPEEHLTLLAWIKGLTDQYKARCSEFESKTEHLYHELEGKENDLRALEAKLQKQVDEFETHIHEKEQGIRQINEEYFAHSDSWEGLYKEKQKALDKLLAKYKKLQGIAIYNFDSSLENKRLKKELLALQDKYNIIFSEHGHYKSLSENWKEEFEQLEVRYYSHREESEQMIKELEEEMHGYVKEYYNKLPVNDPDWFTMSELQSQTRNLSKENENLEILRRNLQKEKKDLQALNMCLETKYRIVHLENENLRDAIKRGRDHFYAEPLRDLDEKRARKLSKECIKAAEEKRARRLSRERIKDAEEKLIENARAWKMKEQYPPKKKEYREVVTRTTWDRWEVNSYLAGAPEEDKKESERISDARDRILQLEREEKQAREFER